MFAIACQQKQAESDTKEPKTKDLEIGETLVLGDKEFKQPKELSNEELSEYKTLAENYSKEAQAALGQKLIKKVGELGTAGAVDFCNIHAIPLTDSVAKLQGVTIKRLTDRPRNPDNEAKENELMFLKNYIASLENGIELKSALHISPEKVNFYFPILTNSFCLNCHGTPKVQVNEATLAAISKKYPNDKALNYSDNQVRGMWSISFDREYE
tara:strand:- start:4650 stop:5285 length:636 start_codon:yes stop_codon:yes gene_type:complete